MVVTAFQSKVLRLIARSRKDGEETDVAGGLALNHQLRRPRVSSDIDVFNSTYEALEASSVRDCDVLARAGLDLKVLRRRDFIVEVRVSRGNDVTDLQWVVDSAYRFFPLVEDERTGLTLHPLDLAANKLAALVGRTEPRDWVDVITASQRLQPLACLLSAACGKDPGFSPASMLEYVARRHYNQVELDDNLSPKGVYDAAVLCRYWHETVESTRRVLDGFPHAAAGKAVMTAAGELFRGTDDELVAALKANELTFHEGHIGGSWPRIIR